MFSDQLKDVCRLSRRAYALRISGNIAKALDVERQRDAIVSTLERAGFADDAMEAELAGQRSYTASM